MLAAATASSSDNTVAIIAIIVAGIVGLAAPIITSLVSWHRLKRELAASDTRQQDALKAELDRLSLQLTSESERLTLSLDADWRRAWREAIRDVLDKGAVLLTDYGSIMSETKASVTPGHLDLSNHWLDVTREVAAQRNRLRLWFEDDHEIVQAFDDFLAFTNWHVEERVKPPSPNQNAILEGIEADFHKHRERYLVAARAELGSPSP